MADIQPDWISTRQAVAALGVSRTAFDKWRLDPAGKIGKTHYFTVAQIIEADRARRRDTRPVDDDQRKRLAEARIRLTEAKAAKQERDNEIARHEMAPFSFVAFALASLANSLSAHLDSIPALLIRQAGINPREADRVRESAASVGNQIANLCDEQWVSSQFDNWLTREGKGNANHH